MNAVGITEVDPCPYCGDPSDVTVITGLSPKVRGWSCGGCGTEWWVSVVNPSHLFLDRLAGTAELMAARSILRGVITLAELAPTLTDEQLRFRLVALADVAVRGSW